MVLIMSEEGSRTAAQQHRVINLAGDGRQDASIEDRLNKSLDELARQDRQVVVRQRAYQPRGRGEIRHPERGAFRGRGMDFICRGPQGHSHDGASGAYGTGGKRVKELWNAPRFAPRSSFPVPVALSPPGHGGVVEQRYIPQDNGTGASLLPGALPIPLPDPQVLIAMELDRCQQHGLPPHSEQPHHEPVEFQSRGLLPSYKQHQSCFMDPRTNEVVFKAYDTELIRIRPAGDLVINAEGSRSTPIFNSLNDALSKLGLKVVSVGPTTAGNWSISDGRTLTRFYDGVVVPSKGMASSSRGRVLLSAFSDPLVEQAAQEASAASTAAAIAAGILPGDKITGLTSDRHPQRVGAGMKVGFPQRLELGLRNGGLREMGGFEEEGYNEFDVGMHFGRRKEGGGRRTHAQGRYTPY